MGTYIIKTPDIGEGIAEVELVAWHVKVGDTVARDQVLADVMTEKATVEVPSPVAGTVLALGGSIGQTVAVGGELVRLEVAGSAPAPGAAETTTKAATAPIKTEPAKAPPVKAPAAVAAQPKAAAPVTPATTVAGVRPIASPAVRRRAWELGIALEHVAASGPAGRIMHADLDAYAARHPAPAKPALASAPAIAARVPMAPPAPEQLIPVIGLRRKIAMRMQDAKRRIPHFTYVEEVDVTEVEALRERLNERFASSRGKLTLLPLLMRAMVLAIAEFPQVNARFDDEQGIVTRYAAVHMGVAAQTDNGLMVPVLRDAQAHDLWANGAEIARLAQAARSGRATRDELSGSTITLTSLGALGGIVSTPVINHPEVAIVGVNRIVERPMVVKGAVVVRKIMNLSSSFDHRVVDGMDAARFIQAIKAYLEVPGTLFVE